MELGSVVISDPRERLCNRVCANLLRDLNYYASADEKVTRIMQDLAEVRRVDPEFVCQLAYYAREVLNVRTTSNFLLAYAAVHSETKVYLPGYFNKSVRLPSDLLEVVEMIQALSPKAVEGRSYVPKVLQIAIKDKFPEFNVYQLGKYCSEGKRKRALKEKKLERIKAKNHEEYEEAKRNAEKPHISRNKRLAKNIPEEQKEDPLDINKRKLSMKQVIRLCHLNEPVREVMAILGKRYPANEDVFAQSPLARVAPFKPKLANKRMKIPTPVTWETEISRKGNRADVWEDLVKSAQLPFMAMLRNLRNMILTGVDETTHHINIARISDPDEVTNSRLFPFRFLSAFEAIKVNLDELTNLKEFTDTAALRRDKTNPKRKHRIIRPVEVITPDTLQRYKDALETAVRIATTTNVKPIMGHSVIFCDVSGSMRTPISGGSGLGTVKDCMQIGILLGLMLRSVCKSADFKIFSSIKPGRTKKCWLPVEIESEGILESMEEVLEMVSLLGGGTDFPYDYVEKITRDNVHIDNLFIFSDMMVSPGKNEFEDAESGRRNSISKTLHNYRSTVNPKMKFVTVDLAGQGRSLVGADLNNDFLNVEVTGYSDAILRLVSEMQQSQVEAVKEAAALLVGRPNPN
jgi:telomerase protein component 1